MHLVSGIDPGIEELNKYLILTPLLKNRTKPTIKCLLKDLVPIYLALLSSEASYIAFGKFFLTALLPTTGEPFCGPSLISPQPAQKIANFMGQLYTLGQAREGHFLHTRDLHGHKGHLPGRLRELFAQIRYGVGE